MVTLRVENQLHKPIVFRKFQRPDLRHGSPGAQQHWNCLCLVDVRQVSLSAEG